MAKTGSSGLYKISINGKTHLKLLECDNQNKYFVKEMTIIGNNIYFLNYALGGTLGDSHTYMVSINGGQPSKIA